MRIFLAVALVLIAGVGALCVANQPTTELVDATGAQLTAGLPVDAPAPDVFCDDAAVAPGLFEGAAFEQVARLIDTGRAHEAKQRLVEILASSERDGEACILLSDACRALGEFDEAADYGLKAVELLPDVGVAHHTYAKALADKMIQGENRLAAAFLLPKWKAALARAIELEPANVDARLEQLTFYTYMPALIGGDLERALELSTELEAYDARKGKLWTALVCQRSGDAPRAIELCEEGMVEFPSDGMFACTLGSLFAEAERFDDADVAFQRARDTWGSEARGRALVAQATMHVEHGLDHEKAIALLDEYLRNPPRIALMPPRATVLVTKGRALEALGRAREARAAYEDALRADPSHAAAAEALESL